MCVNANPGSTRCVVKDFGELISGIMNHMKISITDSKTRIETKYGLFRTL
jgi:hypothetical protein